MRIALLAVALAGCGAKEADDYIRRSKLSEGRATLKVMSRNAKVIVDEKGALPVGTVGPTPAQPCCSFADQMCPASSTDWQHPIWEQLYAAIDMPGRFQYTYRSDGTSFTATASADVQCDGKPVTYTITGTVGADRTLVLDTSQIESRSK